MQEWEIMKTKRFLLGLMLLAVIGVIVIPPYVARRRHLNLDAQTTAIFEGATRVETFRLADFHDTEDRPKAESETIDKKKFGKLNSSIITRVGAAQNKNFATQLMQALSRAEKSSDDDMPSCFDPGVAFRVWHGKESVTVVICFNCSGLQLATRDADGQLGQTAFSKLGNARPQLLQLSQQAFPDDKRLR